MLTVTEVEDGILATLSDDTTLAAYVRAFLPIPSLNREALKKVVRNFPTVGVISTSGTLTNGINAYMEETGIFSVICFNRNVRSPAAAIRGEITGEKGLWDLVEDCRAALFQSDLGAIGIDYCIATRRQLIFSGEEFSAAALEVEVAWNNLTT